MYLPLPIQDRLPHLWGLQHHLVQILCKPHHVRRDVDPAHVIHNPLQVSNNNKPLLGTLIAPILRLECLNRSSKDRKGKILHSDFKPPSLTYRSVP